MDLPPRLYQLSSLPLISSPSHMHTEPSSLLLLLLLHHRTLQFPPFSFVRIPVLVDPSFSSRQAIVVPLFNPIGDRFRLKLIPSFHSLWLWMGELTLTELLKKAASDFPNGRAVSACRELDLMHVWLQELINHATVLITALHRRHRTHFP